MRTWIWLLLVPALLVAGCMDGSTQPTGDGLASKSPPSSEASAGA
jgi:hypothetical protein